MHLMFSVILMPIITGIALLCLPFLSEKFCKWLALIVSLAALFLSILLYLGKNCFVVIPIFESITFSLACFGFPILTVIAIGLFTILIVLYSFAAARGEKRLPAYYGLILITLGSAAGAVFAADFISLIVFWGILGITLYKLIGFDQEKAGSAAKKSFIIIGGADAVMVLGIVLFFLQTGSFSFYGIRIPLDNLISISAYLCLLTGALAKTGAFPLHSWLPAASEVTHSSIMAFLPASLDKLLGIYLLARISLDIFILKSGSLVSYILLIIGTITIITAVMMALVQHNFKKLLAYHAVSQVGYMVLGIGTGTMVGIAGGLFHMLNNTIYKTALFLAGGAVKHQTGTAELDELGGLANKMPITFLSFLIAAFAISGIPPFNGFFSKWMIYQGIIELSKEGSYVWIVWLLAAMFGSALTLASFMKLVQAIFFGDSLTEKTKGAKEVSPWMWLPTLTLASLCLVFGVFAVRLPIKYYLLPYLGEIPLQGFFAPQWALILLAVGLLCGAIFYLIANLKTVRTAPVFTGGEELSPEETKVSATHFYDPVKNLPLLKGFYKKAEQDQFDLYEQGRKAAFWFSNILKPIDQYLLRASLLGYLLGVAVLMILFWISFRPVFPVMLLTVGTLSMVIGALLALEQNNLKKMLSYSSISQLGYVFVGVGLATPLGILGGLLHLLNYAILKPLSSLNVRAIEHETSTKKMDELGGLASAMPQTSATFTIGSLSMAGIPPLGGFWSKLFIVIALAGSGHYWLAVLAVMTSIITLAYLLAIQKKVFFGQLPEKFKRAKDPSFAVTLLMWILALASVAVGLTFPWIIKNLLTPAVLVILK